MDEGEKYLRIIRKRLNEEHGWSLNLPDLIKVFVALVVPLLALAAVVEVYITPAVVVHVFGR